MNRNLCTCLERYEDLFPWYEEEMVGQLNSKLSSVYDAIKVYNIVGHVTKPYPDLGENGKIERFPNLPLGLFLCPFYFIVSVLAHLSIPSTFFPLPPPHLCLLTAGKKSQISLSWWGKREAYSDTYRRKKHWPLAFCPKKERKKLWMDPWKNGTKEEC